MVRIAAAISTVIFGLLLAWVLVWTVTRSDPVVVPTNGVAGSVTRDGLPTGKEAAAILRERTNLQNWRAESGPSPEGAREATNPVTGRPLPRDETRRDHEGLGLVRQWLATREVDWPVLVDRGFTAGTASLPAARDAVLMQPGGRDFRRLQQSTMTYLGGWIIFGVSFVLSLFLLIRGRVPVAEGFSGEEMERFSALERANHWMTATSFILMALTGLILIYGSWLLVPLLGAAPYGLVAEGSLYLHIAFAAPFSLGVVVLIVMWLRQNLPSRLDIRWLKRFGGFLSNSGDNPPARRFNAGQKLVFWAVTLGGGLLFLSGVTLMFPFYWTDIQTLQWVLLGHAALALLMVGVILGHIYIGTIGMEGAFDAMWSGQVDKNWAREHHSIWFREHKRDEEARQASTTPAE